MAHYHLDTNVAADHGRGRYPQVRRRLMSEDPSRIAISIIVVGELLVGAAKATQPETLERVEWILSRFEHAPVDLRVAFHYARLRARLEQEGLKLDANDLWIAATALAHDAILVTADEAFSRVPGLRTENWRLG